MASTWRSWPASRAQSSAAPASCWPNWSARGSQEPLHRSIAERQVSCDPLLLERLIGNLVTNAILYNKPGGWVEVEVAGEAESGPALSVRNTGQDVPAEAVAALFEPFRRLSADRTNHSGGAGLGMSIARSITAAHGGTIRARPRSEGGLILALATSGGLREAADRLARGEEVRRPTIGVAVAPAWVAKKMRRAVGLPEREYS